MAHKAEEHLPSGPLRKRLDQTRHGAALDRKPKPCTLALPPSPALSAPLLPPSSAFSRRPGSPPASPSTLPDGQSKNRQEGRAAGAWHSASIHLGLSECLMSWVFTHPPPSNRLVLPRGTCLGSVTPPSSKALARLCARGLGHTALGPVGPWRMRTSGPHLLAPPHLPREERWPRRMAAATAAELGGAHHDGVGVERGGGLTREDRREVGVLHTRGMSHWPWGSLGVKFVEGREV